jgi:hypothetical protein
MAKAKTPVAKTCQITRAEFRTNAPKGSEVMTKIVEEIGLTMKEFSSGGFGYYGGGKLNIKVGGEVVKCQIGINVSVINSKFAEDGTVVETSTEAEAA